LKRQIEAVHKQHQAEQAQQLEHHQQAKKQWDKKVGAFNLNLNKKYLKNCFQLTDQSTALAQCEEQLAAQRRRAQNAVEELQDVKIHTQTVSARNAELERKQRK